MTHESHTLFGYPAALQRSSIDLAHTGHSVESAKDGDSDDKTETRQAGQRLRATAGETGAARGGVRDLPRLGSTRSLVALQSKLKRDHPEIAASRPSLEKWSKMHHWVERVRAHDKSESAAPPPPAELKVDPNFNQIDALLTAANKALTRAMNAAPVVTKPSDVKALVDAAAHALKLIETIRNQSVGKVSREEVAQEMARVLDEIEKVRLADLEDRVDAELRKLGITRRGEGVTVGGAAPVVAVDHDEADVIDEEPPTAAPSVQ